MIIFLCLLDIIWSAGFLWLSSYDYVHQLKFIFLCTFQLAYIFFYCNTRMIYKNFHSKKSDCHKVTIENVLLTLLTLHQCSALHTTKQSAHVSTLWLAVIVITGYLRMNNWEFYLMEICSVFGPRCMIVRSLVCLKIVNVRS